MRGNPQVSLFLSLLSVGLVTSIHCIFMCGGLVLTYAVKGTEEGPWYKRLVPHLAYQGAKIVSYATVAIILGGIVALLGRAVDITPFRNWLMVVAGVYMVLLGIGMTGKVKALRYLTPRPPKFLVEALSRNRKKASADAAEGNTSLATPISFGLLTGLMPCAPLIAAQASAMATGSPLLGAWAMVGFGLGTMPLMLIFGFSSSLLSRQFQAKLQVVAAVAVMIFGVVILNRGLMVVGSPVTFDTVRTAMVGSPVVSATDVQFKKGADGVVEVPMTIENATFVPQVVAIPADTPVRLIVDRKEANPCSVQLAIPQVGVLVNLADNAVTAVDIPATKAGTYTLTCGMGMLPGSLVVGGAGGGGGGSSTWLALLGTLSAAGGGFAAFRLRPPVQGVAAQADPRSRSGKKGSGSAASRTAQGRSTSAGRASAGRPSGATLWGFQPAEILVGATLITLSILIGLASGGFFR
jgi:sulfite exporter TauE/SafE